MWNILEAVWKAIGHVNVLYLKAVTKENNSEQQNITATTSRKCMNI